jgi:hypothetical protein
VDSNDRAFRAAAKGAFKQASANAQPQVLEPVMSVEVEVPEEFQVSLDWLKLFMARHVFVCYFVLSL